MSLPPPTVNERQRLNVDRSRIRGAELTAQAMISPELTLSAHYLFNDARVRRSSVAPSLVGRRLAQVPRHGAVVGASWAAKKGLHITARLRWIGRQYENDENTLRLGEVVVADIGVVHPLTKRVELFANVENLGDARIETARTADGIVSTGTPRFAFGGVRLKW